MPLPGGFTATPNLGAATSERARDWRLGWRRLRAESRRGPAQDGERSRRRARGDAPKRRPLVRIGMAPARMVGAGAAAILLLDVVAVVWSIEVAIGPDRAAEIRAAVAESLGVMLPDQAPIRRGAGSRVPICSAAYPPRTHACRDTVERALSARWNRRDYSWQPPLTGGYPVRGVGEDPHGPPVEPPERDEEGRGTACTRAMRQT